MTKFFTILALTVSSVVVSQPAHACGYQQGSTMCQVQNFMNFMNAVENDNILEHGYKAHMCQTAKTNYTLGSVDYSHVERWCY